MDMSQLSVIQIQRLPVQESTHIPAHYDAVLRQSGCDFINTSSSNLSDDEPQLTELQIPSEALPPPYIIPLPNGVQDLNNPFEIPPIQPTHPSVQQNIPNSIQMLNYPNPPNEAKLMPTNKNDRMRNDNTEKHYTTLHRPASPAVNFSNCSQPTASTVVFQSNEQILSIQDTGDTSSIEKSTMELFDINSEGDRDALKSVLECLNEDYTAAYWLNVENEKEVASEPTQSNLLTAQTNVNSSIENTVTWDTSMLLDPVPGRFVSPSQVTLNECSTQSRNEPEPTANSYLLDKVGYNSGRHSDILKAAQSLYSKRTRTLWHWINPGIPKTKLKSCVQTAWDNLPDWQKKIYVSQVMGKFGIGSVSPMVNPQIATINDKDKPGPSMEDELEKEMSLEYTKVIKKPDKSRQVGKKPALKNPVLDEFLNREDLDFDEDDMFNTLDNEDGSDSDFCPGSRKRKSRHSRGIRKKIKKEKHAGEVINDDWDKDPEFNDDLFSDIKF